MLSPYDFKDALHFDNVYTHRGVVGFGENFDSCTDVRELIIRCRRRRQSLTKHRASVHYVLTVKPPISPPPRISSPQ